MRAREFALALAALMGSACGEDQAGAGAPSGAGGGGSGPASAGPGSSSSGSMLTAEERLRERLAPIVMDLVQPPFGTAAAVTAVNGALVVTISSGTLWDGGPPADQDTCFNVASVSKLLTAARVVSLAHEAALGLDDPLALPLPGVTLPGAGGADQSGTTPLRHLLQHKSGLPHQPVDLVEKVDGGWSNPELLTALTDAWEIPLVGTPGQYLYSNLGYALLGAIIERGGDCPFAECMDAYSSGLGLMRSTFWPATLDDNAAHGRVVVDGSVEFNPPAWYGSRYAIPFTGLWTTMPSLAHFGTTLAAASKEAESPLFEMTVGEGHGLGPVHGERLGAATLEHDGSGPGFHAALVVIPERDIVLAIVTNGGNESSEESGTFAQLVGAAVEAVPDP